jgi:uncharacterized protein (TIGR02996 family)
MDDRRSLMAAILADPAEDTPRLALADWLDEHGDAHDRALAEFIRLQCEVARLPEGAKKTPAHKRAEALHKKHFRAWLGPLAPLNTLHEFTRGLLENWYCTAAAFTKPATQKTLTEWLPRVGVHTLLVTRTIARPERVAHAPALAWFSELCWLYSRLGDDGVEALAQSPHGTRLTRVLVTDLRCSNAGLLHLAVSAAFPNLRTLGLRAAARVATYTHHGVLRILESDRFPKLDSLDLLDPLPAGFRLSEFYAARALSRLKLLWAPAGRGAGRVCRCPHLTSLETLRISGCDVTDDDMRGLLDNPALANLKTLELWNINRTGPGLSDSVTERLRTRFGDKLSVQ